MLMQNRFVKRMYLILLTVLSTLAAIAQGGGTADVDVNINDKSGGFFTSPIVWVIGAAVFILLLVALTRGRSRD